METIIYWNKYEIGYEFNRNWYIVMFNSVFYVALQIIINIMVYKNTCFSWRIWWMVCWGGWWRGVWARVWRAVSSQFKAFFAASDTFWMSLSDKWEYLTSPALEQIMKRILLSVTNSNFELIKDIQILNWNDYKPPL